MGYISVYMVLRDYFIVYSFERTYKHMRPKDLRQTDIHSSRVMDRGERERLYSPKIQLQISEKTYIDN